MTKAELKLWNELRAHRLMDLGFRRQLPIDGFIVDFACASHKARDGRLEELGWTVLRFWNGDVLRYIDGICRHIGIAAGQMSENARQQPPRNETPRELYA